MTATRQGKSRLLLVDGEHELLAALQVKLQNAGYDVQTCRTGREALDASAETVPELVVLDMHLTDMNGIDVATRLKETYGCPFIFLTNANSEDHRRAAELVGATQYLSKTTHPDDIAVGIRLAILQNRSFVDVCERQRQTEQTLDRRTELAQMIGMQMSTYNARHDVIKAALQRFSRRNNTPLKEIAAVHAAYVSENLELQREFDDRHAEIYPPILRELAAFFSTELGLQRQSTPRFGSSGRSSVPDTPPPSTKQNSGRTGS